MDHFHYLGQKPIIQNEEWPHINESIVLGTDEEHDQKFPELNRRRIPFAGIRCCADFRGLKIKKLFEEDSFEQLIVIEHLLTELLTVSPKAQKIVKYEIRNSGNGMNDIAPTKDSALAIIATYSPVVLIVSAIRGGT